MHERTQRAMARLMFVICCALPTLLTISIIFFTWTPWYHHRCLSQIEAKLSDETGLVVEIDDFQRATPSSLQLSGVQLLDPETRREIASVHQVTWAQHFDETVFVLRQPELQSAELRHVYELLHDRFLCRPDQTQMPVRIVANDLTIHSRSGPLTLRDISTEVTPQARIILANTVCTLADRVDASPIIIRFKRDRRMENPTTQWRLETGNTPLPCSALAECFSEMDKLGSDAMYSGVMTYSEQPEGGASLDLGTSRFTNVELSQVFETLPHKLTGTADLHLHRCLIGTDGTISDLNGILYAKDGLVGGTLLSSLQQYLRFAMPMIDSSAPIRELGYDRIACGFNIRNELMKLTGVCSNERGLEYLPAQTAICAGGQPLVYTSEEEVETIQLANAVSPQHGVPFQLSEQTSGLMRFLKAPSRPRSYEANPVPPRVINIAEPSGGPLIRQGDSIRR